MQFDTNENKILTTILLLVIMMITIIIIMMMILGNCFKTCAHVAAQLMVN